VIRRNSDEELRDLERAVRDDITVLPRLLQVSMRTMSFAPAVRSLIEAGWEAAAITIAPMPLGSPRDDLVVELGRELVRRGWGPDIPLSSQAYRERNTVRTGTAIGERFGQRALAKTTPPVRLQGSFSRPRQRVMSIPVGRVVRNWQFRATYGFSGYFTVERRMDQGLHFFFNIVPIGRNSLADRLARQVQRGEDLGLLRRVAPDAWFLYRWDDSQATTMPGARGGQGLWAGLSFHYPQNPLHFYMQSAPAHRLFQLAPAETPESQYRIFSSLARAYLPGDVLPRPIPADASAEQADDITGQVQSWLTDPVRLEPLRALFYGDLWLGGLLIPPEEIRYDLETLRERS